MKAWADHTNHRCVLPSALTCESDSRRMFCPVDLEKCHEPDNCDECTDLHAVDVASHTCVAASASTCAAWGGKYFCPSTSSCVADSDCAMGCAGYPHVMKAHGRVPSQAQTTVISMQRRSTALRRTAVSDLRTARQIAPVMASLRFRSTSVSNQARQHAKIMPGRSFVLWMAAVYRLMTAASAT